MLCALGSNSTSQASPECSAVSGQNTLGEAGQAGVAAVKEMMSVQMCAGAGGCR